MVGSSTFAHVPWLKTEQWSRFRDTIIEVSVRPAVRLTFTYKNIPQWYPIPRLDLMLFETQQFGHMSLENSCFRIERGLST